MEYCCTINTSTGEFKPHYVCVYSKKILEIKVPEEVITLDNFENLGTKLNEIIDKGKPLYEDVKDISSLC